MYSIQKNIKDQRLRIWFAAFISERSCGGVQRSMKMQSEYLQKSGHEVKIIYASEGDKDNYLLFSLRLVIRLLLNFRNPPDWIIARSTDSFFCALVLRILPFKTKIALHNHGWEEKAFEIECRLPKALITSSTSWKARLIRFPLLKANLQLTDICICGTVEEVRWISGKYSSSAKKMRLIPNGIEVQDKPFWPLQNGVPPNFLMIGGFTWKKNLEYGLQLFKRVLEKKTDAKLYLVGTGSIPEETNYLLTPLGDSLFIVESELPEKMVHWYETCPYFISTSRYEGGRAFSILEAQAKGALVFGTSIPSTRELITDSRNGILLTGTDPDKDSSRILSICFDYDNVKLLGTNAWKSASRSGLERQGQRLLRVLKRKII